MKSLSLGAFMVPLCMTLAACGSGNTMASPDGESGSAEASEQETPPEIPADLAMSPPVAIADADSDALVPGTNYHATAQVPCAVDGGPAKQSCPAGVIRKWGEDGTTLVEVTRPDGRKRALFFRGTTAYGADSAQADGSAAYDFKATRKGDESAISFGPERYVIPDAFVEGG